VGIKIFGLSIFLLKFSPLARPLKEKYSVNTLPSPVDIGWASMVSPSSEKTRVRLLENSYGCLGAQSDDPLSKG